MTEDYRPEEPRGAEPEESAEDAQLPTPDTAGAGDRSEEVESPTPDERTQEASSESSAAGGDEAAAPSEDEGKPEPDDGIRRRWYALHAYSGQEGAVKKNLLANAQQEGLEHLIQEILVPMEEVAEIKSGEKRISKRKFFPGYVLVRLPEHPERNPDLWHLIKNTSGVSGFIGARAAPVPLDDSEVQAIIEEVRGERERPRPKVAFEEGERVKIIDGPFANFMGNIDEINEERGKLKVMVEIFERLTSVEVEFWQVEKM